MVSKVPPVTVDIGTRRVQITKAEFEPYTKEVAVGEAMTAEPYAVAPTASLRAVLREMAEHKWGTAVVVDGGKPVGIVTTTDALRLCVELLEGES